MTDLQHELERASMPDEVRTVAERLAVMRPALVTSLGDERAADALERHYFQAVRYRPTLLDCTPDSLIGALLLCAQVRLEPGPLGHVYLVPFKKHATFILGYTGILELARRSNQIAALQAVVVYERDRYERPWQNEKGWHFEYRAADYAERGERAAVLVSWRELVGSTWVPRALHVGPERVEQARAASAGSTKPDSPWNEHTEAMWAKTGIRAARPWLPLTPDAGYAFASDERTVSHVELDYAGGAQPVLEGGTDE